MRNLRNLGYQIFVNIPPDDEGFIGRECPDKKCGSYFKIRPGTGLAGEHIPTHCPYCGHKDDSDKFLTKEQAEYAKSVVLRQVTGAMIKDLKSLEFNHRPRGAFGIGMSMKVSGQPTRIHHYREKKLETEVVCDRCTLRYTIYGVFGYCPDCAAHNSLQILNKNLELVEKLLVFADDQEPKAARHLTENALEDCVSTFDGFGRETCRVFAGKAMNPVKAAEVRFQNIVNARRIVVDQFGVDFSAVVNASNWSNVSKAFQKRHLLAHKMGVVDNDYLNATGDPQTLLGRKVSVTSDEVRYLVHQLQLLGAELFHNLEAKS